MKNFINKAQDFLNSTRGWIMTFRGWQWFSLLIGFSGAYLLFDDYGFVQVIGFAALIVSVVGYIGFSDIVEELEHKLLVEEVAGPLQDVVADQADILVLVSKGQVQAQKLQDRRFEDMHHLIADIIKVIEKSNEGKAAK